MVSDYNTRCRNKFLRIEIGIAPQDEKRLGLASVRNLASNFAIRMGLASHQWGAVTHKDTGNIHIHIIANRISLYGEVYDTTFVSNKAARVAKDISRKYGMTITKEIKVEKAHQKAKPIQRESKPSSRYGKSATPCSTNTKAQASQGIPCSSTTSARVAQPLNV